MCSTGPQDMKGLIAAFIGQGLVSNITVIGIPLDGHGGGLNELFGDGGHDGLIDLRGLDGRFGDDGLESLLAALFGSDQHEGPLDDLEARLEHLEIQHLATCPNCSLGERQWPPELQEAVMYYRMDNDLHARVWFAERALAAANAAVRAAARAG